MQNVIVPTLHDWRNKICNVHFGRMRRGNHKLNYVLPGARLVSYALRSFKELPFPMASIKRYKYSR